jgi:hypothetical protein
MFETAIQRIEKTGHFSFGEYVGVKVMIPMVYEIHEMLCNSKSQTAML